MEDLHVNLLGLVLDDGSIISIVSPEGRRGHLKRRKKIEFRKSLYFLVWAKSSQPGELFLAPIWKMVALKTKEQNERITKRNIRKEEKSKEKERTF